MLPQTVLAQQQARRLAKSRRKPPRQTLPLQTERLYLGALRRYWGKFEALVREALAPELGTRTDARRPPRPIGFVTRHTRTLDTIRPTLQGEIASLPYDEVSLAVATHVGRQMVKVLGVRASSITSAGNLRAFRQRNVDLITGLTEESLTRIAGILDKLDTVGPLEIAGELDSEFGFGRVRAELIARDQVLKYNGEITHEAHRQAGIAEYIWSTSQDESVRSSHADLEGTRHGWDDPPVVADDGRTAHPGEDFQCRCVPIPVLPELGESA